MKDMMHVAVEHETISNFGEEERGTEKEKSRFQFEIETKGLKHEREQ